MTNRQTHLNQQFDAFIHTFVDGKKMAQHLTLQHFVLFSHGFLQVRKLSQSEIHCDLFHFLVAQRQDK